MPRNVAQLAGMMVTTVVVFGTDLDVYYALPLGIFAGALATFFMALADYRAEPEPAPIKVERRRG